jgi:lipopolysaccharide/colanic/teichoic acid biosynthesis glycosyltransferase
MRILGRVVYGTRIPFPASRGAFKLRVCVSDMLWAAVSPLIALYLSDAYVLYLAEGTKTVAVYCVVSFFFAAIALLVFGIQNGMMRYFSAYDVVAISKAVIISELMICMALFGLTRLDGIPRSAPIIHSLLLATGLIAVRAVARMLIDDNTTEIEETVVPEHVIMIGSNRFSSLYIQLLQACASNRRRVVAVLDNDIGMIGRTIEGVRVVGTPEHLDAIIEEYIVHGVDVDRVVVGGDSQFLSDAEMQDVYNVCSKHKISLQFVSDLVGRNELNVRSDKLAHQDGPREMIVPIYFKLKYLFDLCAASIIMVILLPLFVLASIMVLIEVGSPVLFWQQRVGTGGRSFLLYKFRTLRPPFDWRGEGIPPNERLSWIGYLMRETSLDELPQLLNVLVGDMSLIGPRPLLPEDQPANASVRLTVRPGITGWAQVNGRKLLTADEKEKFDEWYIRNASLWLDLQIILRTLQIILLGESGRAFVRSHAPKSA